MHTLLRGLTVWRVASEGRRALLASRVAPQKISPGLSGTQRVDRSRNCIMAALLCIEDVIIMAIAKKTPIFGGRGGISQMGPGISQGNTQTSSNAKI